MVVQDAAELLVCVRAGAFALEADDECFGRVFVEEVVDFVHHVAEVVSSC